jgi:hypothetical protein
VAVARNGLQGPRKVMRLRTDVNVFGQCINPLKDPERLLRSEGREFPRARA